MKRILAVLLTIPALAACQKKETSTAHMPEFYVFKTQPYCLAEATTSEGDLANRKKEMVALVSTLLRNSQGWAERYNVVGVDYIDFKKLTLVIKGACDNKQAVDLAIGDVQSANKKFAVKVGGDAALVGDAAVVEKEPSVVKRFAVLNPDEKIEDCLMHFRLPRAGEDRQGRVPGIMGSIASQLHFPLADIVVSRSGDSIYMLLARNCGPQRDTVTANISEILKTQGFTDREFIADKDPGLAEYLELRKEEAKG